MSFPPATEMFQFAGFASSAYEFSGRSPKGWGFPIRKSRSQRVLASRPSLSQRATSFIASQCQGIHQMPLKRFIITEPENTVARRDKTPPRDPFRFPYLLPPVQPPAKTSQRSNGHEDTYLLENIPAPAATRQGHPRKVDAEPGPVPRTLGSHHIHNVKQHLPKITSHPHRANRQSSRSP